MTGEFFNLENNPLGSRLISVKLKKLKPSYVYRLPIRLTLVAGIFLATVLSLYLLVSNSTPTEVGPIGITSLFILVFVATITMLTLVKMIILRSTRVSIEGLVGLSLVPTLILALGSLRQLSALDVALIIIFAGLINFYVKRATAKPDAN